MFDANASMLVHDQNEELPYKTPFVHRIKSAFDEMLRKLSPPLGWDTLCRSIQSGRLPDRPGIQTMPGVKMLRGLFRLEGFRYEADSKDGLPEFVQEFHLPFGVLLEMARDGADHVAAHAGQFFPGRVEIGELGAMARRTAVAAGLDAEIIQRHDMNRSRPSTPLSRRQHDA